MPTAPAPRKTLIFHIGDHKTGSTSIQNAFASGRVSLPGHSVLYPGTLDHNYLDKHVKLLADGKPAPNVHPGMPGLKQIADAMAASDADVCLLSGESFESVPPEALRNAIDRFFAPHISDLKIIVYVRPHAGRILSTYSEQTKIGWFQGTPEGMFRRTLKSKRFFYAPRLRRWRAIFGDQFVVRPMLREEMLNRSVVDDFIATAFGGQSFEIAPGASGNESLGLEDLMLLKHVHAHLTSVGQGSRLGLGWEIAQRISAASPDRSTTKLMLHRALARKIHNTYLEDAQAVDAEFFGNRGLFAADLDQAVASARPKRQSCAPEDYFTPRELRNIALLTETLAGMLGREKLDWAYWFRSRRAEALKVDADAAPSLLCDTA